MINFVKKLALEAGRICLKERQTLGDTDLLGVVYAPVLGQGVAPANAAFHPRLIGWLS